MRAIADANEASAMDKVAEEIQMGRKMEKLENQAKVNEAINKSTKIEESRVIEAANKRMSDINKIKEENANKSSKQVNAIKAGTKKALKKADS